MFDFDDLDELDDADGKTCDHVKGSADGSIAEENVANAKAAEENGTTKELALPEAGGGEVVVVGKVTTGGLTSPATKGADFVEDNVIAEELPAPAVGDREVFEEKGTTEELTLLAAGGRQVIEDKFTTKELALQHGGVGEIVGEVIIAQKHVGGSGRDEGEMNVSNAPSTTDSNQNLESREDGNKHPGPQCNVNQKEESGTRPRTNTDIASHPDAGLPTDRYHVGDVCEVVSDLIMRVGEALDSPIVQKLEPPCQLKVTKIGTSNSGKRLMVQCLSGVDHSGWVSCVSQKDVELLKLVQREAPTQPTTEQGSGVELAEHELFTGVGQSLGGAEAAANPRQAALAAAERRQQSGLSHGVSEKKSKELAVKSQREVLIGRINDMYSRKNEDPPMSLQSATVAQLEKHLDHLRSVSQRQEIGHRQSSKDDSPETVQQSEAALSSGNKTSDADTRAEKVVQGPAKQNVADLAVDELHPEAIALLADIKGSPDFRSVQELVAQGPSTLAVVTHLWMDEHAHVAALEPRLTVELENVLKSGSALTINSASSKEQIFEQETHQSLQYQAKVHCGLTAAELQDVLDLEQMGFGYGSCLEAYLSCKKNVELAANLLLEGNLPQTVAPSEGMPQQPPPIPENVQLSLIEWEAVSRIEELGFDRKTSLSAFLQHNRDEELAGNQLLM